MAHTYKFPHKLYIVEHISITDWRYEATSKYEPHTAIYYNVASRKLRLIHRDQIGHEQYFKDEQTAIASVLNAIGPWLEYYQHRLTALGL